MKALNAELAFGRSEIRLAKKETAQNEAVIELMKKEAELNGNLSINERRKLKLTNRRLWWAVGLEGIGVVGLGWMLVRSLD